jgi:hypothetical protein
MKNNYKLKVNEYGNIKYKPEGWIYVSDIPDLRNISVTRYKNIPSYKVLQGFENTFGDYYKPSFKVIIHKDHVNDLKNIASIKKIKTQKKNSKLKNSVSDLHKVIQAIYSINKEAKRQRDIQENITKSRNGQDAYRTDKFVKYQIQKAKAQKNFLYDLKSKCLSKLINISDSKPIGYHTFRDGKMNYYKILGFGFHVKNDKNVTYKSLGVIENKISSVRKTSGGKKLINPKDAIILLENFLETN